MHFCQASSARARPCVGRHLRPYGTGLLRRGPCAACARRRCGLRGAETGETGRASSASSREVPPNKIVAWCHVIAPHRTPDRRSHDTARHPPHPYVTRRAASGHTMAARRETRQSVPGQRHESRHHCAPEPEPEPDSTRRHVKPHHETSRGHSSRHTTRLVEAPSPCARRPSLKILYASLPCPSPSERGPASDTVLRAIRRLLLVAGSPRYRARRPAVCTPPRRGG